MTRFVAVVGITVVLIALAWFRFSHSFTLVVVAPPERLATPTSEILSPRRFLVKISAAYKLSNAQEQSTVVVHELFNAGDQHNVDLPFAWPWKFKRLSIELLHPGYQPLSYDLTYNPHAFPSTQPIELSPELWPLPNRYTPIQGKLIEVFLNDAVDEYMPLLSARELNLQIYPHIGSLLNISSNADYSELTNEERVERLQNLRAKQSVLTQHAHPPGYTYVPGDVVGKPKATEKRQLQRVDD